MNVPKGMEYKGEEALHEVDVTVKVILRTEDTVDFAAKSAVEHIVCIHCFRYHHQAMLN